MEGTRTWKIEDDEEAKWSWLEEPLREVFDGGRCVMS
jgi:hypothetical protein